MLVLLGTVLLSASVFAGNDGPIPPHLKACANISITTVGNCPKKGFECDELLPIRYSVHHNNWARAEVKCVDKDAYLAVDEQIVDHVRCRDSKWRAEGNCDIPTTSVVCAKYCDADACPASLHHAYRKYDELTVYAASAKNKCAVAKCKYGFVAFARNGTLLGSLPSSTSVSCSGDGKWTVSATQKYSHLMCKRKPKSCDYECNDRAWGSPTLNATSAAIRNGCEYSCPAGQVLSRPYGKFAISMTCASCTRRGFLLDDYLLVSRIGCSLCDVVDGPVASIEGDKRAISTGCVLTCPRGYRLRYGLTDNETKFAPGNEIFRQIHPVQNNWITTNGFVLTRSHGVGCVRRG